ncbi:hypothetical protein K490DRAFT_56151 [Saccharata proteae CBS 121410]|uniref:Nucleolar protein 12 n=1 Tax=Saccharata proteae CBS 121410 TaxID=1314787 RepID=A0A9P4HX92_9PEZI|nr:hypothetical protein K490DRAFT_56151 [Saccharata proteae CBS 121410]
MLIKEQSGPVEALPKSRYEAALPKPTKAKKAAREEEVDEEVDDEELSEAESSIPEDESEAGDDDDEEAEEEEESSDEEADISVPVHEALNGQSDKSQRKRKRKGDEEEIEDAYMGRLAREEAKEEAKLKEERSKKRLKNQDGEAEDKSAESNEDSSPEDAEEMDVDDSDAEEAFTIPQHEALGPSKTESEMEKAACTVFLGNVSTEAITSKTAKKTLLNHMASFIPDLPDHTPPHKVESLRFRSTAYSTNVPKKAAFAKKELMEATTKSTNAYVVYSTRTAAREAAKRLNGTVVLDRHLRVDEVAHPAKADHKRCVFVGNLGFVDDESMIQAAEEEKTGRKQKKREPSDVEEGLWRQMGKAGTVESVRVVRDPKTRVGKGFAYVQFTDQNGVEAALLFNDKRFPPLLPRKLRVVRAKAIKRNKVNPATSTRPAASSKGVYNPKISAEEKSKQGRASKLFGRAGASQQMHGGGRGAPNGATNGRPAPAFKTPESFVFEGHRATSGQGKSGLKLGGSGKKKAGKPRTRSSKRGAAWKAGGGKKQ